MLIAGGSTNVTTYFKVRLTADGTAATGLTPANFDLQYTRSGAAPSTKVDATLNGNGVGGAHSDSTVIEVDATSSPGLYRVDWVDAAFVAGVREVILSIIVATAYSEALRVEIDGEVNVVEWGGTDVVAGAIPAVAANGAGGLPISDVGGLDMDALDTAVTAILAQLAEVDNDGTAISHAGAMKLVLSIITGITNGGGTSTLNFRDLLNAKNRLTFTVDADGNRLSTDTRDAT